MKTAFLSKLDKYCNKVIVITLHVWLVVRFLFVLCFTATHVQCLGIDNILQKRILDAIINGCNPKTQLVQHKSQHKSRAGRGMLQQVQ